MQLLFLLLPIIGLAGLIGWIWLVTIAFKKSTLWGVGVLIFFPAAIVFAIKNWEESKTPFLIYCGSCLASFLVMFLALAVIGGAVMNEANAQFNQEGFAVEPTLGQADPGAGAQPDFATIPQATDAAPSPDLSPDDSIQFAQGDAVFDADRLSPAQFVPATMPMDETLLTGKVSVNRASDAVGQAMRITGRDGLVYRGFLAEVKRDSLVFERYLNGGTFAFELPKRDVKSLELLDR